MPRRSRRRKTKFVTKRAFPFLLMKNAETKAKSVVARDEVLTDALPAAIDLSEIGQGDDEINRTGNEIQISSVFFKATFSNSLDATNPTDRAYYARVILYTSRNPDEPDLDVQPMEFPDRQKYIIWADKVVAVPWLNQITHSVITIKKRFKPYMKAVYDGAGTLTCLKGKLRIMISVDSGTAQVLTSYMARQYFKDV